jgi:hypothetical protein
MVFREAFRIALSSGIHICPATDGDTLETFHPPARRMNGSPSGQTGRTSRFRLVATAVLVALPVTAAAVWWITPANKPPDLTTENHMGEVRSAAATSVPLVAGATVSLPGVEEWLNPTEGGVTLGHRLTVLDFTTLW